MHGRGVTKEGKNISREKTPRSPCLSHEGGGDGKRRWKNICSMIQLTTYF